MTVVPNGNPNPDEPNTDPAPTDPATPPADAPKTFTQEQVNRFNIKAKKDGEAAAIAAVAEQLGMPIEDAKAVIEAHKAKQDEEKTEIERLREQNEALQKDSEAKTTQLQRDHHTDRVKYRLSRANLALPEDAAEAEKAIDRVVGLVSVEVGASAEDIDANIDELKGQFPSLFVAQQQPEEPKGNPPSAPSGVPRKPQPSGSSSLDRAKDRAAKDNAKRGVTQPTA